MAFRLKELLAAMASGDEERTRKAARSVLLGYQPHSETWLVMRGVMECAPCTANSELKEWLEAELEEEMSSACSTSRAAKYVPECRDYAR